MDYDIKFFFNIKDKHLVLDKKMPFEECNGCKIIHFIQTYEMKCPACGKVMLKNGFKTVKIKAFPIGKAPTIFSIKKQKYICHPSDNCPKTITKIAEVKGIKAGHQIANTVTDSVMIDLTKNRSIKDIAQDHYVSSSTIIRSLNSLSTHFNVNRRWLPRAICLDDFKSGSALHDGMSMVLMNAENSRVIDVIKSRKNRYLKSYFLSFSRKARLAVRLVVVDLYDPYRKLINELFPNAIIIADHFHIVVQAYTALQKMRIHTMNAYGKGTHEYRALKRFAKLLMTNDENIDFMYYAPRINFKYSWMSNSEVIERLLSFSDDLRIAYNYYQDLLYILSHHDVKALDNLLETDIHTLPAELHNAHKTLKKHYAEIVASLYSNLSNGPLEGINNKIKVLKRTAYGFRNFDNFRLRILLYVRNTKFNVKNTAPPSRQSRIKNSISTRSYKMSTLIFFKLSVY